ncbi:MAG: sulfatase-like hydrolase/transferase [Deltaproteobacteria bacterium]|uniref:Sulfatase-like hydrolase/transferase n=1 Tax=Candidatus Zymogenus saltonus TaxID=2844893 RepID=A0A9D8KDH7_9DELT|nr:sulfatase-like hydrolase/transferase [Candidatus Zymogenus saltonus]
MKGERGLNLLKRIDRREFIKGAAATGTAAASGFMSPSLIFGAKRPNILMITVDEERRRVGFPKDARFKNHDRIAERGVTFNNYHVTSPLCGPSRSSMYTGLHVPDTEIHENLISPVASDLSLDIPPLGRMLRDAGYYTGHKGKWHLSRPRRGRGYDLEPYGFANNIEEPYLYRIQYQSGYEKDSIPARDTARWLKETAPEIARTRPWFMSVDFINPHDIMHFDTDGYEGRVQEEAEGDEQKTAPAPNDPIYRKVWNASPPKSFFNDDLSTKPNAQREYLKMLNYVYGEIPRKRDDLWRAYIDYYINCTLDVDRRIGEVLDALEESGQADNTIVIFTSDHGEMAGAHGLRQKLPAIYRENTNVPLVICHPDVSGGFSTDALASGVDLVPTIMAIAGISEEKLKGRYGDLPGYDLTGQMESPTGAGRRAERSGGLIVLWSALHGVDGDFPEKVQKLKEARRSGSRMPGDLSRDWSKRGIMRGMFDGRYKFARYFSPLEFHTPTDFKTLVRKNDLEIYDTASDPDEIVNLAHSPEDNRELVIEMNGKLNGLIKKEIKDDKIGPFPTPMRNQNRGPKR